jgi:hypothetical protein
MKKAIIFLSPIILLIEIMMFNGIAYLLSQKNDIAVLVGIASTCAFAFINYILFNFIKSDMIEHLENIRRNTSII